MRRSHTCFIVCVSTTVAQTHSAHLRSPGLLHFHLLLLVPDLQILIPYDMLACYVFEPPAVSKGAIVSMLVLCTKCC
jgi:hypothetical protein